MGHLRMDSSPCLVDPHVPFNKSPDLSARVSTANHPIDELVVFGFGFLVPLGAKADNRQKVLNLAKHPLFDHPSQLFVFAPIGVAALIAGPRAQHKFHNLISEVFGVGNPGRLLDFLKLLLKNAAVQNLTGIGVFEILILDPGIRKGDITIKQVLAVIGIGLQIRLLDLVADKFRIPGRQIVFHKGQIPAFDIFRELFAFHRLFQNIK